MPGQFIRKVTLIVAGASGDGLDLSQFRVVFKTVQSDGVTSTPNTMTARVYNLSDDTARKVQKEYTKVTLQAGYRDGNQAVIFTGTIKQAKRGRENPTDTFLEIFGADGDEFYTHGVVNKTLAAGWTQKDVVTTGVQEAGGTLGDIKFVGLLNPSPRGKVMYGMMRQQMKVVSKSTLTFWSIDDGKVSVTPITSYKDGEAVVINSATGMVGLPEQTEDGIAVSVLLNPKIQVGCQVHIDQESIQKASVPNDASYLSLIDDPTHSPDFYPPVSDDGFYKAFVVEHHGDTRGNDYLTDIICLSIDKSADKDKSVKVAG